MGGREEKDGGNEPDFDDLIEDYINDNDDEYDPEAFFFEQQQQQQEPDLDEQPQYNDDHNNNHNKNGDRLSSTTNTATGKDPGSKIVVYGDLVEKEELAAATAEAGVRPLESNTTMISTIGRRRRSERDGGGGKINKKDKDVYTFERYTKGSLWRSTTEDSTNSTNNPMKKKTRTAGGQERQVPQRKDHKNNEQQQQSTRNISTSESQKLMDYMRRRQRQNFGNKNNNIVSLSRRRMPLMPIHGRVCIPMTLGDGTRVHIPKITTKTTTSCSKKSDTATATATTTSAAHHHPLGISMSRLMERVQALRRRDEHSKHHPTRRRRQQEQQHGDNHGNDNHNNDYLWVDKHSPTSFAHLLTNERTNRDVLRALRAWDPYVFDRDPPTQPTTTTLGNTAYNNNSNKATVALKGDSNTRGGRATSHDNASKNQNKQKKYLHSQHSSSTNTQTNNTKTANDRRPDMFSRVILLHGPPGVGKTTMAHVLARHAGYRPLEVNGSDERSTTALTERVIRGMESMTLDAWSTSESSSKHQHQQGRPWSSLNNNNRKLNNFQQQHNSQCRPNCLILDEIDGADAKSAIPALVEIIRADIPSPPNKSKSKKGKKKKKKTTPYLRRPIIFICNNKYSPALRTLLPYAKQYHIVPPTSGRLVERLRSIIHDENLYLSSGNTLLHQLVTLTGGDIRSCLFTLQFASSSTSTSSSRSSAAAVVDENNNNNNNNDNNNNTSASTDIASSLKVALNGEGLKDERNDLIDVITKIFRKEKQGTITTRNSNYNPKAYSKKGTTTTTSTSRVLDSVQSFGDSSRIVDCLFLNVPRVSYIDPTLERCAAANDWLSTSDAYYRSNISSSAGGIHSILIDTAAAAIHLLCRVEQQRQHDLTFTNRELTDVQFQMEANESLTRRFVDVLSPRLREYHGMGNIRELATTTIPYVSWILSSGVGCNSLQRMVTSVDVLSHGQRHSFDMHVTVLRALKLTYHRATTSDQDNKHNNNNKKISSSNHSNDLVLEPPIDRLTRYKDLSKSIAQTKHSIPSAMKELLARRALRQMILERNLEKRAHEQHSSATSVNADEKIVKRPGQELTTTENDGAVISKHCKNDVVAKAVGATKGKKRKETFLGIGARKAKEARAARNAARVGIMRTGVNNTNSSNNNSGKNNNRNIKLSNTGSGVPMSQVIRLKYVKGFTQAVRTPCRLEDLA